MDWRTLKPGDTVCTCTQQHRPIIRIEDVAELKSDTLEMSASFLAIISPTLAGLLYMALEKSVPTIVVERIVYFADGATCHATRCLTDPKDCLHQ